MVSSTISHYKILAKVGEGGMGVVYKAEDTKLDRPVALKFLSPLLVQDQEVRKRFEREAKAAAALSHPNVCTVYEIDEVDGRTLIAMEFVEGESLDKKIERGPLKIDEALDIARQIVRGLEAAHKKGIFHRDIKPANVIVGEDDHVTIVDFGLAQLAEASRLTRDDTTLGTAVYMSPEQTEGSGTDHRTDIWSLGVVLYEMITGQHPFKGDYDQAVMYSILNEQPEPLTALRTGVPMELERIVFKCVAKAPGDRYQSASELLVDLRTAAKESSPTRSSERSAPPSGPSSRASRPAWLVAAGLLVALVALLIWALPLRESAAPTEPWRVRRLTSTPAVDLHVAASPVSSLIVYAGAASGNLDLYAMPIGGGKALQLTSHVADDATPALSPDGEQVVFTSGRDGGGIYLMSVTGGVPERLVTTNLSGIPHFILGMQPWRVTGGRGEVLFSRVSNDGRAAIWKIDVATFEETQLSRPPEGAMDLAASWSPDGRRVVFFRSREARWGLRMMSADGGEERAILDDGYRDGVASWTPDGERIVFSSRRSGTQNLWELTLATGELRQITVGPGSDRRPTAVDGKGLFYVQFEHTLNLIQLDLGTGNSEPLTFSSIVAHLNPRFSPDGRFLVFDRAPANRGTEIVKLDLTRGEERALTDSSSSDSHHPDWSPASDELLFVSDRGEELALWLMDAEGRGARKLGIGPDAPNPRVDPRSQADAPPRWSPTGKVIAYVGAGDTGPELWSVRPDGSKAQRLVSGVFAFDWYGADGRVIVYTTSAPAEGSQGRELRAIHLDTGRSVVLLEGVYANLDVSSDSSALAYVTQDNHLGQQFFSLPLSGPHPSDGLPRVTGPAQQLANGEGLWHPHTGTFSPDGNSFVYDRDTDRGDVYLIENYQ